MRRMLWPLLLAVSAWSGSIANGAEELRGDAAIAARMDTESLAAELSAGRSEYRQKCAICHGPGGTGTLMLGKRLGAENGLLAARQGIPVEYVEHVVRTGIGSMPPFTPVDITDAELERIAVYLARQAKGVETTR